MQLYYIIYHFVQDLQGNTAKSEQIHNNKIYVQ